MHYLVGSCFLRSSEPNWTLAVSLTFSTIQASRKQARNPVPSWSKGHNTDRSAAAPIAEIAEGRIKTCRLALIFYPLG